MSRMMDYIVGKADGPEALLEAQVEHMGGHLETALKENQELRAALDAANSRLARMEQIALFLWDRLDDIDTLSDAVKCDDKAYRSGAERINRRRFDVGSTDGYTVTLALSPTEPAGIK